MNSTVTLFVGVQLFSIVAAALVLFEHRKLCCVREEMFCRLGDDRATGRRRMRHALVALYVCTTLFILILSSVSFVSL